MPVLLEESNKKGKVFQIKASLKHSLNSNFCQKLTERVW